MKMWLAVVGAIHIALFLLGSIGVLDYHLCVKGANECSTEKSK
jgi:hypothetical protein